MKMYDSVNTRFNLDRNDGKGVESGSGRIRRDPDLDGYVWPRFIKFVDFAFTCGEFPHR